MKFKQLLILSCIFFLPFTRSYAWGPEGHAIVGRLAMQFVKEDVRKNILVLLGNMPVDSAANWMDKMKSDQEYEFMRPWHYLDFPKGQPLVSLNNDNILSRLQLTYAELLHKNVLCDDQVRMDLYILLHLMGDLHMPLHTGYEDDLGGNKRIVQYDTMKTHNLHLFWDEDIIRLAGITDAGCMKYYNPALKDTMSKVDFMGWMTDSRSLLDGVYDFPDFTLDKAYLDKNKVIVEKQLLKAGLRLALILNKLFTSPAPAMDFKSVTAGYKNGIDVKEAYNNVGNKVTVCTRVFSIRATPAITQISAGDKYPNNPLTIIIFSKNYYKFKPAPEELYKDRNICVKGTIELYKGKPQIIVEDPDDIIIL